MGSLVLIDHGIPYKLNPIRWLTIFDNECINNNVFNGVGISTQHTYGHYLDSYILHYIIPLRVCTTPSML